AQRGLAGTGPVQEGSPGAGIGDLLGFGENGFFIPAHARSLVQGRAGRSLGNWGTAPSGPSISASTGRKTHHKFFENRENPVLVPRAGRWRGACAPTRRGHICSVGQPLRSNCSAWRGRCAHRRGFSVRRTGTVPPGTRLKARRMLPTRSRFLPASK